jgi:hypothetical protein
MEIKIGKIGKILAGDDVGSYVKVVPDSEESSNIMADSTSGNSIASPNTGGFLILIASDFEMKEGFDGWVEDSDTLRKYFEQSRWVVQWLE